MANIHVIDFEGSRRSGVVEYGVATITGGRVVAAHTRLCAPTGSVTAAESAVHGISENDIAAAAPFAAEQALFADLRQSGPFAAHHATIEQSLLRRAWPVPPAAPDFAASAPAAAARVADWGPWLDTRRIYENLYPAQSSYQLMDLIQAFVLSEELTNLAAEHCPAHRRRAHCALYDALAAALLLLRLTREPTLGAAPLTWLVTQSRTPAADALSRQSKFSLDE